MRKDYHVIAPDPRGHGDSDWSVGGQYTLPEYVLDIAQLIDVLDLAPLRIVAHSMGAPSSPSEWTRIRVHGCGSPSRVRRF